MGPTLALHLPPGSAPPGLGPVTMGSTGTKLGEVFGVERDEDGYVVTIALADGVRVADQ